MIDKAPTNHKYNYYVRLYFAREAGKQEIKQVYLINAKDESNALRICLNKFKHTNKIIIRASIAGKILNKKEDVAVKV